MDSFSSTASAPSKNLGPVLFYSSGKCSLSCLIAASWSSDPFRACRLDDGYDSDPEFLKLNPLGEVPTLVEYGEILTENVAILHRIGNRARGSRIDAASDTIDFDRLNRALGYIGASLHGAFKPVFMPEAFHDDAKIQAEIRAKAIAGNLKDQLRFVNDHVVRNGSVFGHPTIADAYLYAVARWAKPMFSMPKDFPEIARFFERMEADPAVQFALAIETGKQSKPERNFRGHVPLRDVLESLSLVPESEVGAHGGLFTVNATPNGRTGLMGNFGLA